MTRSAWTAPAHAPCRTTNAQLADGTARGEVRDASLSLLLRGVPAHNTYQLVHQYRHVERVAPGIHHCAAR
jgi:hypothetical protein